MVIDSHRDPGMAGLLTVLLLASACVGGAQTAPPRFSMPRVGELPTPTQMHGAAVVGSRLYCIGGNTAQGWMPTVRSAEIGSAGRLGSWRDETPLPESRCYIMNSVEVINDRIYVIAGGMSPIGAKSESEMVLTKDILWTSVDSQGRLAPWKRTEAFPGTPVANVSTAASENCIYVTGGNDNTNISTSIFLTAVGPDGSPGPWRDAGKLPVSLWFHGAAIQDKRLYVWGGLTQQANTSINRQVFSADVKADGNIGTWREEAAMPQPVYSSAFCGFNDYMLCLGGRYSGGTPTTTLWYTRLENGRIHQWRQLDTDLETRLYHAAGLDAVHGTLFSVGGRIKGGGSASAMPDRIVNVVQAFRLPQPDSSKVSTEAARQFVRMPAALEQAQSSGKPLLLFLLSPQVPASKRSWDNVVNAPGFQKLTEGFVTAVLDVSTEGNEYCYKYGVFKIPAFVLLSPKGELISRMIRIDTLGDLQNGLSAAVAGRR